MALHMITHEEIENQRYAEDEAREHDWNVFVADVKATRLYTLNAWAGVVQLVADAMHTSIEVPPASFEARCRDFAEVEGWSGTINAVARAIREKDGAR